MQDNTRAMAGGKGDECDKESSMTREMEEGRNGLGEGGGKKEGGRERNTRLVARGEARR